LRGERDGGISPEMMRWEKKKKKKKGTIGWRLLKTGENRIE
jgi:hypothetical protein